MKQKQSEQEELKELILELIKKNPNSNSRLTLTKYVNETEFVKSKCGYFVTDVNNTGIKFLIKKIK